MFKIIRKVFAFQARFYEEIIPSIFKPIGSMIGKATTRIFSLIGKLLFPENALHIKALKAINHKLDSWHKGIGFCIHVGLFALFMFIGGGYHAVAIFVILPLIFAFTKTNIQAVWVINK